MRSQRPISAAILALAAMSLAAAWTQAAEPDKQPPSRRPPAQSPGEKAKVSLFGIEADGYKIVYVFDRSGSMGTEHNPLAALKKALIRSLQAIDSVHQFQIVSYNEHPRAFNPSGQPGKPVFGTDQNKAQAEEYVNSVVADGGTDHEAALVMALKFSPDVVYLMTDGDDPKLTAKQLERIDRLGAGTIINTIEFGAGGQSDAENFLVKLAQQSGGKHVYVDLTKTDAKHEGDAKP